MKSEIDKLIEGEWERVSATLKVGLPVEENMRRIRHLERMKRTRKSTMKMLAGIKK